MPQLCVPGAVAAVALAPLPPRNSLAPPRPPLSPRAIMMLAIQTEEDEEEAQAQVLEKEKRNSFALSQSGTFKLSDFAVNKGGMHDTPDPKTPAGAAAPSQPAAGRLDVKSLDELVMMEELGAGASGSVRKAKHMPTGEIVAVKQITILEKAKRDQMVTELRITRQHACPWIVSVHNAFYDEGCVYVVLEFMDYGSLQDLVDKHAGAGLTDETELAKLAIQMLNGLNYLHRQHHQVHRDLKPANVLLNRVGQVKISDFGISSQLDNTNGMCSTFVGSTCYMGPERLSGRPYSYAADVWSFGLIMLELALGKYPYGQSSSYFKLLGDIQDAPPPTVPEDGAFTPHFAEFVSLCLSKDPQRRPNANELLKHPWLRRSPVDHLLLSGLMESMTVG